MLRFVRVCCEQPSAPTSSRYPGTPSAIYTTSNATPCTWQIYSCTSPGLRETLMDYTMYTDLPAEQSLRSRVGACDCDRDWCRLQGIEGLLSTYLFELSGDCAYILIMGES